MQADILFGFLSKNPLLFELTREQILALLPFFNPIRVKKGDWILREGEKGDHVFLLYKGSAEILKHNPELHELQKVARLEPGDWVGEMAHFEKISRSASVRATQDSEIFVFDFAAVDHHPELKDVYRILALRLATLMSRRLREATETLVHTLKEKLHFSHSINQVSRTIIYYFILIAGWINCYKLVKMFPNNELYADQFLTVLFVILGGLATILIVKSSHYPLSFYGLTTHKMGWYALEGLLYSLPIMGAILGLKWILIQHLSAFSHVELFPNPMASGHLTWVSYAVITVAYAVLVPVQEFVARGVLQSCLRNFFQGPDRAITANFTANILFQILHTVKDFWLAITTFFLGVFWGYLFEKQRSLVGASVSHALIGMWTYTILDFQQLIDIMNP